MLTRRPWQWMTRGLLVVLLTPSSVGQAQTVARDQGPAWRQEFALDSLRSFRLGGNDSAAPASVKDAVLTKERIIVLDGESRKLFGYDRASGRHIFTAGRAGSGPGEFEVPHRLILQDDTIFVLDVTHKFTISAFDQSGAFLGRRAPMLTSIGGTAIALADSLIFLATLRPRRSSAGHISSASPLGVMLISDLSGHVRGVGCTENPLYAASRRTRGVLQRYAFRDLAMGEGRLYCIQPVSSEVQVLDLSGRTLGRVDVRPPFYEGPVDVPIRPNESTVEVLRFQSSWTFHERVFARESGFLSVYSRYNMSRGAVDYWIFGCDVDLGLTVSNCKSARVAGRPVRVVSPDSLFIVTRSPAGMPTLTLFRLR